MGLKASDLGIGAVTLLMQLYLGLMMPMAFAQSNTELEQIYNRASEQIDQGNFTEAVVILEKLLAIAQQQNNQFLEATALNDLALVYRNQGNAKLALQLATKALKIYQQLNDEQGISVALNNQASAYLSLGQYPQAIQGFEQALKLVQKLGETSGEVNILSNLGAIYQALGQHRNSLSYFQQALTVIKTLDDARTEGILFNNIGSAYISLGEYEQAKLAFEQSLKLAKQEQDTQGIGQLTINLGAVYERFKDYEKAFILYQEGLPMMEKVGDLEAVGQALNNIGYIYRIQNQYPQAFEFYQKALEMRRKIQDKRGEAVTLINLGVAEFEVVKLAEATQTLYSAIEIVESLRPGLSDANKVSFFETLSKSYGVLQQVLIEQKQIEKALEVSERGRARAFVELVAQKISPEKLTSISIKSPNFSDVQKIAKLQNATLVEYSVIVDQFKQNSTLLIWVIKPDGAVQFRSVDLTDLKTDNLVPMLSPEELPPLPSLNELIRGNRANLDSEISALTADNVTNKQLNKLYQLLIEPIADLLPKNPQDRIIFIPHQDLLLVPFPALVDEQGNYLIQKHTILTSPSIQLLQLTADQQKQQPRNGGNIALVLGNPKMPKVALLPGEEPQFLQPLPASEKEAIAIAKLLQTEPLLGEKATESNVIQRIENARYIHLATHGILSDLTESGIPGAIALSPSASDDGLLTSEEILRLNLTADLVVLSACNTGAGTITSDGILGLSRSLIAAGIPSLIVSLWKVPDTQTAELMQTFYQQLQQTNDKAQALRQAMLITMKNYPNPQDWAGFILIGQAE
ncbi:TPR repeat-containing protein [Planktothrix serta PCC 8927]|uniref:TPR repeat-containing protein n=1 Tax=Planktothrix serta PCC 8927 TaxID=671068 RepID=A0A7Z9C2H4_9CYAN|nr:CHAT domain-containing tetratricopeptide repeat protein [Planktothrix serta]VXD24368.1 TPR repeat-containing protein [Planktothrix serta PCC 8927]